MQNSPQEPRLRDAFKEGFSQENIWQTLKNDYRELKEFYLSDHHKKKLEEMGTMNSTLWSVIWLLKLLFLRLSPLRRLILLAGIVTTSWRIQTNAESADLLIIGPLIILFVLMLELKDKLLAKDELEAGRKVQLALMPHESPVVPGWDIWLYTRPANDVGGDLLDFVSIGDSKYAVALGDVSGKGLGAALLMAKLQATIRALANEQCEMDVLGQKINSIFMRDRLATKFASLLFLCLTTNSGEIKLFNAGHMPLLHIKNNTMTEYKPKAPAFGLIQEADFPVSTLELQPGECIVLYSDGISEARNHSGDFFGEEQFRQLIKRNVEGKSAMALGEIVLRQLSQFQGDARLQDDVSIAILRRVK